MLIKEEMGEDMASDEHMDDMLTVREVARLLHVHPNTLRRWSDKGRIVAYRINPRGDRRYRLQDIDSLLAQFNPARDSALRVR
jgi:excisionase family DNA binding protein